MKKLAVQIVLRSNQGQLLLALPEKEAHNLLAHVREGRQTHLGGFLADENKHWVLDPREVAFIITEDFDAWMSRMREQQQAQMRGRPSLPGSHLFMSGN